MSAHVDETECMWCMGLLAGKAGQSLNGRESIVAGDLARLLPGQRLEFRWRYSDRPVSHQVKIARTISPIYEIRTSRGLYQIHASASSNSPLRLLE